MRFGELIARGQDEALEWLEHAGRHELISVLADNIAFVAEWDHIEALELIHDLETGKQLPFTAMSREYLQSMTRLEVNNWFLVND